MESKNQESIIQPKVLEILQNEFSGAEFGEALNTLEKIKQSETIELLRLGFVETSNQPEMLSTEVLDGLFTEYIEDWGTDSIGNSVHEVNTQKAMGINFWQTTVKREYVGEMDFLFNVGFLMLIRHFEKSLKEGDQRLFIKELHPRMLKLIEANGIEGQEILQSLALFNISGQEYEDSTLLTKLMAGVFSEIAGLLMKIKFFQILRKGQNPHNN